MSGTGAKSSSATADALRLAFTYLLRPNCGAISRGILTSKTCEVSTCFMVDSRLTLDGTLHSCQPMIGLLVNSCDLRRRMPQARSSWIAPLTCCSWRTADAPQRQWPLSSCQLTGAVDVGNRPCLGAETFTAPFGVTRPCIVTILRHLR